MTTLYFIRHGQTQNNVNGILSGQVNTDLTQKGRDDAKEKSKELEINFDYYYCSSLKRTQETLKIIKGEVPFIIDNRIIDIDLGDWTGIKRYLIRDEEYIKYAKREFTPPNGETAKEVDDRIISFIEDMFLKYKDKKILIVTHGIIIRFLKLMFNGENVGTQNLEVFEVTEEMIKGLKQ